MKEPRSSAHPLRVLLATSQFEVESGGGAARSARVIANGLVRSGHEVCVVTSSSRADARTDFVDQVLVHRLSPHNLYWVGAKDRVPKALRIPWQMVDVWNPMIHRKMVRLIAQFRPHVVHANKIRGLSPAVWTAASKSGVPIVQTCRDYELMSPEGTLEGRLGEMARNENPLLWPYQEVRRRLSRLVQAATAPSSYSLQQLQSVRFFPNALTRVIPNSHGLSNAELAAAESSDPPTTQSDTLRLIFQGRLEALKGILPLCEIVERLAAKGQKVHLTVVGSGSLTGQLVERFGQSRVIDLVGPLYGQAKHDRISQADLCVAPSTGTEVFGNVVVEGYAAGRPALVSSAGGLPELVREDRDTLVFQAGGWAELESRLGSLTSRLDWVRGLRARSFEWARAYTEEQVIGEYERLYRQLLASEKGT